MISYPLQVLIAIENCPAFHVPPRHRFTTHPSHTIESTHMKKITRKQFEIVSFIQEYIGKNAISPSLYEIAEHFAIRPSTASAHITALERKHVLVRSRGARRSVRPVAGKSGRDGKTSHVIPLYTAFGCFPNAPASRYCIEASVLPREAAPADLFALRAGVFRGPSREIGVVPGDILIVWTRPGVLQPGMLILEAPDGVPVCRFVAAAHFPDRDTVGRVVAVLRAM